MLAQPLISGLVTSAVNHYYVLVLIHQHKVTSARPSDPGLVTPTPPYPSDYYILVLLHLQPWSPGVVPPHLLCPGIVTHYNLYVLMW